MIKQRAPWKLLKATRTENAALGLGNISPAVVRASELCFPGGRELQIPQHLPGRKYLVSVFSESGDCDKYYMSGEYVIA